ncbi:MAG: BMP family protein, partial [Peptidiphaga sp.]
AKNHAGTKIVGVDSDWYQSAPEYKDIVLTSVQKGIARAVYDTIKAGADGKFDKKPYVGTLKNGGVSLAPFHDFEGSLPAGLTGELDAIKKEIVEGKTVVTSKSAFDAKGGSGK